MKKAFIFDMDGVIIATEKEWLKDGDRFANSLFGEEINRKIGSQVGFSIEDVYKKAVGLGFTMEYGEFLRRFDSEAKKIFQIACITPGFEELVEELSQHDFRIAVVTASPREWVDWALSRTSVEDKFDLILSTHGMKGIRHKPFPDGYLKAMEKLKVTPKNTVILEDSNPGIKAAKASGVYTIALKENLVLDYEQSKDADVTVEKMADVWDVVKEKFLN